MNYCPYCGAAADHSTGGRSVQAADTKPEASDSAKAARIRKFTLSLPEDLIQDHATEDVQSAKPTTDPAVKPAAKPTAQSAVKPTTQPAVKPTAEPSTQPPAQPTSQAAAKPTAQPSAKPAAQDATARNAVPEVGRSTKEDTKLFTNKEMAQIQQAGTTATTATTATTDRKTDVEPRPVAEQKASPAYGQTNEGRKDTYDNKRSGYRDSYRVSESSYDNYLDSDRESGRDSDRDSGRDSDRESGVESHAENKAAQTKEQTKAQTQAQMAAFGVAVGAFFSRVGSAIVQGAKTAGSWLAVHTKDLGVKVAGGFGLAREKISQWLEDSREKRALKQEQKIEVAEAAAAKMEEENLLRIKEEAEKSRRELRERDEAEKSFISADDYIYQTGRVDEPDNLGNQWYDDSDDSYDESNYDESRYDDTSYGNSRYDDSDYGDANYRGSRYDDAADVAYDDVSDEDSEYVYRKAASTPLTSSSPKRYSSKSYSSKGYSSKGYSSKGYQGYGSYRDMAAEELDDNEGAYEETTGKETAGKKSTGKKSASKRRSKGSPVRDAFEWVVIRIRPGHIVAVLVLVLAIALYFFIQSLGSPTRDFAAALQARNYEQAALLYTDKYKGNEELQGSSQADLAAFLSELKQNAIDGATTYSATEAALDVLRNSDLYVNGYKTLIDDTTNELTLLRQADSAYLSGQQKLNNLDYAGAIEDLNQVVASYPGYRKTNDLLGQARDGYRDQVVKDVGRLQSQNNYTQAGQLIDQALRLIPDDPALKNLKATNDSKAQSSLYQSSFTTAERYFQSGDYTNVLKTIDDAIRQDSSDDSLKQLRQDYELRLAESILNTADSIFMQGDREGALAKVAEGLALLPNNQLLTAAQTRYTLEEPGTSLPAVTTDPGTGETEPQTTDSETTEPATTEPTDAVKDNLQRGNYDDAAGTAHPNSVLQTHTFTGDASAVDQLIFQNDGSGSRFTGVLALGPVDEYTQVYYQIYSSSNPGRPLRDGSLIARPGDDPGSSYKIDVDLNANNAGSFIVNVNYLQGGEIRVVLDLRFTR